MIVVDTSVWIDHLNDYNSSKAQYLTELLVGDASIGVPGLVLAEILAGLRKDADVQRIRSLLDSLDPVPELDRDDYVGAAKLYRHCRSKGLTVSTMIDCLIAQLCVRHNLLLLTKDKEFSGIARFTTLQLV